MNNIKVSFGQKIPIASCKLKNSKNEDVKAKVYELDCKDLSDIAEITNAQGRWRYRPIIYEDMLRKFAFNKISNKEYDTEFYVLENEKDGVLGMTEVVKNGKNINIQYIEAHDKHEYKHVGKSLIGAVGLTALKHNFKGFGVNGPVSEAMEFYTEKCGFKEDGVLNHLNMEKRGVKKLIRALRKENKIKKLDRTA
jgi:hypothetical protein